jgi:hypothetical protein
MSNGEEEPKVWAVTVGNLGYGGRLYVADRGVRLPKSEAEHFLRMGAVRKPTRAEREKLEAGDKATNTGPAGQDESGPSEAAGPGDQENPNQ